MSYVRWSTPLALPDGVDATDYYLNRDGHYSHLPTSDFYIYDHIDGFVSVNVAGNRHRPQRSFVGKRVTENKANKEWLTWLEEGRERIDHPAAGQTFEFADMADAIAKVEELIGEGFLAPDWLLDSMRYELTAKDAQNPNDDHL